MNPMSTFDPSKPAMVHDRLNDRTFEWTPETMQANDEQYAEPFASEIIGSDGLLLDGWSRYPWSALVQARDQSDAVQLVPPRVRDESILFLLQHQAY
jgi:hypothetical protein